MLRNICQFTVINIPGICILDPVAVSLSWLWQIRYSICSRRFVVMEEPNCISRTLDWGYSHMVSFWSCPVQFHYLPLSHLHHGNACILHMEHWFRNFQMVLPSTLFSSLSKLEELIEKQYYLPPKLCFQAICCHKIYQMYSYMSNSGTFPCRKGVFSFSHFYWWCAKLSLTYCN